MHLLKLPIEIRLRIYEELLACPSAVVESVPHRISTIKFRFQIRTVRPLSPQLLRVCRQIHLEARRVLYSSHQFNCAFSILGIGKLRAQIGPTNFGHIKHIIGWSGLRRLSYSFRNSRTAKLYMNLETLTIQESFLVNLGRPGNLLDLDLCELSNHCKAASEILCQHPLLSVLAQTSIKDPQPLEESGTALRIKWTLRRSSSAMLPSVSIDGAITVDTQFMVGP
jgi:hypothetical protein